MPSKVKKQNIPEVTPVANKSSDLEKIVVFPPSLPCLKSVVLEIIKYSDSIKFNHDKKFILDVPTSKKDDIIQTLNTLNFQGKSCHAKPYFNQEESLRRSLLTHKASDINLEFVRKYFGASEIKHIENKLYNLTFNSKDAAEKADKLGITLDGTSYWLSPMPQEKRRLNENESPSKPAKRVKMTSTNSEELENDDDDEEEEDEEEVDEEEEEDSEDDVEEEEEDSDEDDD